MPFFGSLKKAIKTISDEVAEIKKVKPEFLFFPEIVEPAPNIQPLEPAEIKKKQSEMETKIKNVRIATSKAKVNFKHRQGIFRSYFYDVEDLVLDILAEHKSLEKKLVQYGYCPLEVSSSDDELKTDDDDMKKPQVVTKLVTPKLRMKKFISISTPELNLAKEKLNKTPELHLEQKPKELTKSVSTETLKKIQKFGEVARKLDF